MTNKIPNEVKENAKMMILAVLSANKSGQKSISVMSLLRLVALTARMFTPTFVRLHDYVSASANETEAQDVTLILGANYGKAKAESIKKAEDLTAEDIAEIQATCTPDQIKGFKYINKNGLTAEQYCKAVADCVPMAVEKKKNPKSKADDGRIRVTPSLHFFPSTGNINLFAQKVKDSKAVTTNYCAVCGSTYDHPEIVEDKHTACPVCKAVIKDLVANKPMTIAGKQIDKYLNSRTSKISTYTITRLGSISILGENLNLVPVEEEENA